MSFNMANFFIIAANISAINNISQKIINILLGKMLGGINLHGFRAIIHKKKSLQDHFVVIIIVIIIIIIIIIIISIIIIIIIISDLFSVDQINRIHNHSIYVKTIANIEDKC